MSMAGMISMESPRFYEASEIGQYTEPDLLALFRVKLAGEKMIRGDAGDEAGSVLRRGGDHGFIFRRDIIGVNEIDKGSIRDPLQERRFFSLLYAVPAHVGGPHREAKRDRQSTRLQ